MSARYLSQRRDLRVAVVDTGIGISGSLAKREKLSDVDAVSKVLEGFSSKSQGHNMGLGIRNITDIVRMFHGELIIISGSAGAVIRGAAKEVQGFDWSYPGTAVMFRMRLDPPVDEGGEDL